ncbi:MAG: SpoIIE family protein phosphatase, partial [Desulfovibrio sp.]|nr:SpoIIE family protein phosphatase [Desulfovibrio sp.]
MAQPSAFPTPSLSVKAMHSGSTLYHKFLGFILLVLAIAMLPLMAHDLYLSWQNAQMMANKSAQATLHAAREHISSHLKQSIAIEAGILQSTKLEMRRAAKTAADLLAFADHDRIAQAATLLARTRANAPLILFRTGRNFSPAAGADSADPALLEAVSERARTAAALGEADDFAVADSSGRYFLACLKPIKGAPYLLCLLFPLDEAGNFASLVKELHREGIVAYLKSLATYPGGAIHVINARTLEDFREESSPLTPHMRFLIQQAVQTGLTYLELPAGDDEFHCFLETIPGSSWILALTASKNRIRKPFLRMLARQTALLATIMLLAVLAAIQLGAMQFRPLGEIIDCVRAFPSQDFTKPLTFGDRLPLKRKDEFGALARALMDMGHMLQSTLDGMLKATAAKERMESELDMARRIQEGLLPAISPEMASHPAFELSASVTPARLVGGDFYDAFFVDETKLLVALGDVSGKGVPAALFMSSAVTLLRGLSRGTESPAAVLCAINKELAARNPENMFVTLAVGLFDTQSSVFTFALAGHPAPVLVPGNGAPCRLLDGFTPELVAGVMEDACYHDHAVALAPGDALFFYTDGISEAPGAQGGF